ncbi:NUDIX domain-containing protein [Candidatus Peregrinibacteria bacterium]|jgi:8-oxo-dGTP diphosphatase|nr:NUDIX domain-containing protein [Candidatus Peregrinibacteria bacterium]
MQASKIAVRAIILHEGKILLVKHKGKKYFSLPGGKLEGGEDMKSGLERELFEELGTKSVVGKLCFIHEFEYPSEDKIPNNNIEFFFLIKNGSDFLEMQEGSHAEAELDHIEWVDIESKYDAKPDFLRSEIIKCNQNTEYPMQYFSMDA